MRKQAAVEEKVAESGAQRRSTPAEIESDDLDWKLRVNVKIAPRFLDQKKIGSRCGEGRGDGRIEIVPALHLRPSTRGGGRFGLTGACLVVRGYLR